MKYLHLAKKSIGKAVINFLFNFRCVLQTRQIILVVIMMGFKRKLTNPVKVPVIIQLYITDVTKVLKCKST